MAEQLESPDQKQKGQEAVNRWLKELQYADQHEKKWRERAEKIINLYRDERERDEGNDETRFNILFSNTEVLKGALYSQVPVPDCRRRFLDKDPTGKQAARVLQRGLSYSLDAYDFDGLMQDSVEDMLLPGRGIAYVKYIPTFANREYQKPVEPVGMDDMGAPSYPEGTQFDAMGNAFTIETIEELVYEEVVCNYTEWDMFRYSPAKRWSKVRWVAFGELLTRDQLKKQFGEKGVAVKLHWTPEGIEKDDDNTQMFKKALVWKIWNKTDRKVYIVSEGYKQGPLDVWDDPLKLEGFFPCPRPLYNIKTTNSLIPVPDYAVYQDHAMQLDEISERIKVLVDALKRRGVYDASQPELEKLATAGDNTFIPVENYVEFVEKGGLEKLFQEADISLLAKVILSLKEQAEQKKQDIYEIIGISDIMRGITQASETLGAQEIKNQWGSIRVSRRQKEVQRYARDLLRLKAEIIAEHFSIDTLKIMTGIEMSDQEWMAVKEILSNDKLRGFKVDIETDSTVQPNADREQKNRVELITAVTGFMEKMMPAVQQGLVPKKVATEMMMFGVRAFPVGPELEETLDQWAGEGDEQGEQDQQSNPEQKMQQMEMQKQSQHADQLRSIEAQTKQQELEKAKASAIKEKAEAYKSIHEGEAMVPGQQLQSLQAQLGIEQLMNGDMGTGPEAGRVGQPTNQRPL